MLNMQDIGYYLFMQEQEEKQKDIQLDITVNEKDDFIGEQATTKEKKD